jgi:nucleoside-diphosphate-sugar epimerase
MFASRGSNEYNDPQTEKKEFLMRVLITGANGFIGSHLAERCIREGWDVACLVRNTSDLRWLEGLKVDFIRGDISEPDSLKPAFDGVDVVFHLAGKTKAPDFRSYCKANAEGTANMLEAAARYAPTLKRFVHASSAAAAGPSPSLRPMDEDAQPRPVTWYGMSKLKSERICASYMPKIPVAVIRPPAVYGPRDRDIYDFFKIVSLGIAPILGDHEKYISMVHARDLVEGFMLAAVTPAATGNTYYIANKNPYPFREMLSTLVRAVGKPAITIRIPHDLVHLAAGLSECTGQLIGKTAAFNRMKARELCQRYWICDVGRAERDLGYGSAIPLEDGFFETAEWYRSQGWI